MIPSERDEFWADVQLVADEVRAKAKIAAYLATGGSDGCAQCVENKHGPELSFKERVERGHLSCAEAMAATKGAQATAYGMGEVWIDISRVMKDPRFGQWLFDREDAP